ncbi:MAG: heat shock protein GrpE [Candidatus Methanoperedens nitroreducens]|uniref:Protein GrpE n=1 Tax=Candidatus Methanoperedens nitratireducens TaxID=1392998 RepID=A0A0P8CCP9_9EURY|nr:nucleotide exchange factor GrpE [Candidatus Methanoperedens sp. BLZ2]KAB2942716.1 MAG: nucleotide exchange factor GrpE [Candidatus Methanoperedens sp.]KPQ44731.1 MAG: heat shock protein GrpE [Candidatus Methanoperedens sp. BLZ1]MBZ0175356.1 nucleotide exchange factor GrpE [Candidatus Methanoperedens nitroreducens]MCX9079498.1 nucleotide exchange factor GrpE [Candidatus Methanoperedens sp.]MCX9087072.1 nucleotide exchange factor GrpE [Candidatus Methanoperedens sp.]
MKTSENNNKEDAGETEVEEAQEEITETTTEEKLEKELSIAKKQLEEEKDRCLRLNAEFDNLRKRNIKERDEFIKYANEKLIQELIDVYESLERGIENAKKADNNDKLIKGMELVYKQFKSVLEKNGLVPIKALGEKFDHRKHEAMMQTLTDEQEEDTILEEFAKGYMLNGKVIRYSKVRVSKRKGSEKESDDETENEVK